MLRVLDTTVLIDFLRGRPVVDRVLAMRSAGDVPATTAVNVEEIVRGLRGHETDVARGLLAGLAILPIDAEAAWRAGSWRRAFAERGVMLHQANCLIAAASVLQQASLATGNPDDFPMSELTVEHWPVGH